MRRRRERGLDAGDDRVDEGRREARQAAALVAGADPEEAAPRAEAALALVEEPELAERRALAALAPEERDAALEAQLGPEREEGRLGLEERVEERRVAVGLDLSRKSGQHAIRRRSLKRC